MVGDNSAALAAQKEAIRPELPQLMLLESVFWPLIKTRTDLTPVSSRPTRVPTQPISGGLFRVMNPDGGDAGRGSGPQEVPGYLSCASYLQASEYTAQSQWATDSGAKAIQNYVSLTHEQAFQTLGGYLDVLAKMDGSNTIDTVVGIAAGNAGLLVNSANFFQSNQVIDIWSAVGGTFLGTYQIEDEDIQSNTIWTTTPITVAGPNAITAGCVIMVSGSSGQANSGMFGILYYGTNLNVGNFMQIPRASYPGRYTAQGINMGGMSLTPAAVRAIQVQIIYALGGKVANSINARAHCGPDMKQAWENNALPVQSIIYNEMKGDNSADMLKRDMSETIAGRPILMNARAIPGRIDFLDFDDMWRLEVKPTDYMDVGGQTEFPAYGQSGGILFSTLFYIVMQAQLGISNARKWSFLSNVAIPKFILGK